MQKRKIVFGVMVICATMFLMGNAVAVKAADEGEKPLLISTLKQVEKEVAQAHIRQVFSKGIDPTVEWDEVEGADGYRVYRKMPGDEKYVKIADTTELSYTDRAWLAEAGTKLVYKVRAFAYAEDGTKVFGKFSVAKKWISKMTKIASEQTFRVCEETDLIDQTLREGDDYYYYNTIWLDEHYYNYASSADGTKVILECCDYEGNSVYGDLIHVQRPYYFWICEKDDSALSLIHVELDEAGSNFVIKVYGCDGSLIANKKLAVSKIAGYPDADDTEGRKYWILSCTAIYGDYLELSHPTTDDDFTVVTYLSLLDGKFHKKGSFTLPELTDDGELYPYIPEFDTTKWEIVVPTFVDEIFFACLPDESEFFYLDQDHEIIASFYDCSEFTKSGYSLVSEDRMHYYVMNKDLEIIGDTCYLGNAACISPSSFNTLTISRPDGADYCIRVTE